MLQLAERLLKAAGNLVPEEEKIAFLFHNKPPLTLTPEQDERAAGR